ncbi:C40 family peptidase [Paenibacillus radicis (ex Xue et al. 2023)]|uniref:C40 family peptidase n=1 Tax=Paenibacillus radicis (ex Xue et al. 2023) TaxID=2972489 RepID=A0ABT1YST8_9BACL|nr:C40 family peptidase [Paenibacillus radicis (ex Xue et al. 2023)]MCR8636262.1 C40 family peptidase [Paenibacillus radicis (ex Xue et al. 2023)]
MVKRTFLRTAGLTTVMTVMLTGAMAGSAFAAYDDMDAVSLSKELVGKDYTKGGESLKGGFDESGLNYYVYKMLDYKMPRALADQFKMDKPLIQSFSSIKEGDVLFFGKGNNPSSSGIYVGNDKMIMASSSKDRVVTVSTQSYKNQFIGARRILSANDQKRVMLVLTAQKYLGTPYDFGAKYGQTKTFDCSSFMKWIYSKYNIDLPRISRDQAKEGKFVSKSDLDTGDLVFFTTKDSKGKIGHVGMYIGDGMMIHTYGEGGVKYSTIESGWWDSHYVTARRVIN